MKRVLVAGASGQLGRHVVASLARQGQWVRAVIRDPARPGPARDLAQSVIAADLRRPDTLADVCRGIDAVISCAGAPMRLDFGGDRASFTAVDFEGNRNLLGIARAARVETFVYVSLFGGERLRATEYADAHERFVAVLGASGLAHVVVRPTGYFSFFAETVRLARRGLGPVLGPGTVRTNPVHEADVAEACVDAIGRAEPGGLELPLGGPDVYTRREIVELAFTVLGRRPRLVHVPAALFAGIAPLLRPINPRVAALLEFGAAVSVTDVVAPAIGRRPLREYFEEVAREPGNRE